MKAGHPDVPALLHDLIGSTAGSEDLERAVEGSRIRAGAEGNLHLAGAWTSVLADVRASGGDHDEAERLAREALVVARGEGCLSCEALALTALGVAVDPVDEGGRAALFREALEHVAPTGDSQTVIWVLDTLAGTVAGVGEYEHAARLFGGADGMRAKLDRPFDLPGASGVRDRGRALAEEALGTVRLAELTDQGRHMPYADMIAFALGEAG